MEISPSALGALLAEYEENFASRGEIGASVSVWWRGSEVLSEGQGWRDKKHEQVWTKDTLVPVYSATKGPASATLLMVLDQHGLGIDNLVREVWEKFPVDEATFGDLLSHQCGLAALDDAADIREHEEVVAAIERQSPAWALGEGHGYHPRTFGSLVDEPVRKLTGKSLGQIWNEEIARPYGLDFWIGLPESEWGRVATLFPGKASAEDFKSGFYQEFSREDSLTNRAFRSPRGLRSVQEMNDSAAWSAGFPAMGGLGTASALAKFYQIAIGAMEGPFSDRVLKALSTRRVDGDDKVLMQPTSFAGGCQLDPLDEAGKKLRQLYGPELTSFGHPGAGGSHAFGDPENGISFAYTMNQMELSVMPGRRCERLVAALYDL